MKINYTKHAEEKLKRPDIKNFKINKKIIEAILKAAKFQSKTKYGDFAEVFPLNARHDLRIIYDIINSNIKVITFHVSQKGRYK